ncbi:MULTISPECIES: phasin family protein [unclassified Candidatus Tisiphia]|uniref:Phasin domain-containing protein n=1 Tax=Candidatus Tisiphia endosymbiont of Sergentomyia squamirostris TaxID=3113639 RepID=A0AAT9G829_9RICK
MTNSTAQFVDFMKSFMNPEVYINSVKNLPVMDFSAMSDTIKKSTKILTTTNQIVTESLQSMIQKNSEDFQNNAMNMLNSTKDAITSGDLNQIAECQQKYLKSTCETSINNIKEFVSMASDTSMKMFDAINSMTGEMTKTCDNIKNKA